MLNNSTLLSKLTVERDDLNEKIERLNDFINNQPPELSAHHASLLLLQIAPMRKYAAILQQRIELVQTLVRNGL